MEKKQLQATIYGRVQGVSFRYYTQREADKIGIVGWVANQWDGTVRTIAEGDESQLQQFLQYLHKGPSHARVTQVDTIWAAASGEFNRFEIRHL
jgi:acylphosphatase